MIAEHPVPRAAEPRLHRLLDWVRASQPATPAASHTERAVRETLKCVEGKILALLQEVS